MGLKLPISLSALRDRIPGRQGSRTQQRGLPAATAVEVDGDTLRVAEATRSGSASRVESVRSVPLDLPEGADRNDPAVLGAAVAKALARAKVRGGPVVMGIPRTGVLLRTVAVPDTGAEGTIASLVQFQVARDLPFRADEAVVDFQVLRRLPARPPADGVTAGNTPPAADAVDRVEVLAAVARRDAVQSLVRLAEAAGFPLAALGWVSQANAVALRNATPSAPGATRAAVVLRGDEVGIEVVRDGALVFSRGVPVPPADASDAGAWIRTVTIEVVRTLHAFAAGTGLDTPAAAFVFGGTGREQAVAQELRGMLGVEVDCPDLSARLGLGSADAPAVSAGFSVAGLAAGATEPAGLGFDFLNPKLATPPVDTRRLKVLAGAVAGIAVLVAVFAVRSTLVKRRQAVLDQLQSEIVAGEKNRPAYRQKLQQAATLRAWSAENRDWLDHYAHLSAVLPPSEEVYLSSIAFGPNNAVRLAAQARSGEILAKIDRQLRAAGYDVKPLAITPVSDRNGYGFRTTVELTVPARMKFDLAKLTPPARPADDASLDAPRKGGAR